MGGRISHPPADTSVGDFLPNLKYVTWAAVPARQIKGRGQSRQDLPFLQFSFSTFNIGDRTKILLWRKCEKRYRKYFSFEYKQKHGHTPNPIEAFNFVHKRKDKHKSWIDDAYEQMGLLSMTSRPPELRFQAYVTARGFETGDRVRG
ncbi:Uncharacterized protein Fot_50318 [Forsythia ovata]|uniref:Uncharacterized protein n=1 Tax=Forsythia ovata TaxID=205694 RepID=A0ABD1PYQ2_9LAMI